MLLLALFSPLLGMKVMGLALLGAATAAMTLTLPVACGGVELHLPTSMAMVAVLAGTPMQVATVATSRLLLLLLLPERHGGVAPCPPRPPLLPRPPPRPCQRPRPRPRPPPRPLKTVQSQRLCSGLPLHSRRVQVFWQRRAG